MSDYTDKLGNDTATNYSVQPGGSIHESFPAQASGGTSEHSDSEGDGVLRMMMTKSLQRGRDSADYDIDNKYNGK